MICYTGKGTKVDVSFVNDVEPNEGGYYCEIARHETLEPFDNFCIHPTDCDCTNWREVEKEARQIVAEIKDY